MTILDYPRWRHLIVDVSYTAFNMMWQDQFGVPYELCNRVTIGEDYIIEGGGKLWCVSDWNCEYTDQPVLGADGQILIRGNIRYAIDLIGQPYWLLDPKTGKPRNFEAIVRIEMIKRYMKKNGL